jgi:hypothetical protein
MALFGTQVVPLGEGVQFAFGALQGAVEVRPHEWRVSHRYGEERDEESLAAGPAPPDVAVLRVATDTSDQTLVFAPVLPDGDVVMRTDPPIHLLPGNTVDLYVGTPIGLSVRTSRGQIVVERCAVRLEHTWFGPNVRDGEVCLSMRSHARSGLAELPRRPHRAVTVLTVRNEGDRVFSLERLRLPMGHLGLHRDSAGRWWTEGLEVVVRGGEAAHLAVGRVPKAAGAVEQVVHPRKAGAPNPVLRALDALFSERW